MAFVITFLISHVAVVSALSLCVNAASINSTNVPSARRLTSLKMIKARRSCLTSYHQIVLLDAQIMFSSGVARIMSSIVQETINARSASNSSLIRLS